MANSSFAFSNLEFLKTIFHLQLVGSIYAKPVDTEGLVYFPRAAITKYYKLKTTEMYSHSSMLEF